MTLVWPNLNRAFAKKIEVQVLPNLVRSLPAAMQDIWVSKMSLGTEKPRIGPLRLVTPLPDRGAGREGTTRGGSSSDDEAVDDALLLPPTLLTEGSHQAKSSFSRSSPSAKESFAEGEEREKEAALDAVGVQATSCILLGTGSSCSRDELRGQQGMQDGLADASGAWSKLTNHDSAFSEELAPPPWTPAHNDVDKSSFSSSPDAGGTLVPLSEQEPVMIAPQDEHPLLDENDEHPLLDENHPALAAIIESILLSSTTRQDEDRLSTRQDEEKPSKKNSTAFPFSSQNHGLKQDPLRPRADRADAEQQRSESSLVEGEHAACCRNRASSPAGADGCNTTTHTQLQHQGSSGSLGNSKAAAAQEKRQKPLESAEVESVQFEMDFAWDSDM